MLDWAGARGLRSAENPARWRGHLDKLLPARAKVSRVRHHPAMPYRHVPAFVEILRAREGIAVRALEFTILTAARTGEVIGALPDEFDLADKVWTVPGSRMKAGREHRVPLSDAAVDVLKRTPRFAGNRYMFAGQVEGRHLSSLAMLGLTRDLAPGFVPHGFRSSFRDWAAERTSHPASVAEAALAHVIGDRVVAAYLRGEAMEKRRALMNDWAAYCMSPGDNANS